MKRAFVLTFLTIAIFTVFGYVTVERAKTEKAANLDLARSVALQQWNDMYGGKAAQAYAVMSDDYKKNISVKNFTEVTASLHIPAADLIYFIEQSGYSYPNDTSDIKVVAIAKSNATTTAFRLRYNFEKVQDTWRVSTLEIVRVLNAYNLGFQIEMPEGFTVYNKNYYTVVLRGPVDKKTKKPRMSMYFDNYALTRNRGVYKDLTDFVYVSQANTRDYRPQYRVDSEGEYVFTPDERYDLSITGLTPTETGHQYTEHFLEDTDMTRAWHVDVLYNDSIRSFSFYAADDLYDAYLPVARKVLESRKFSY